MSIEKLGTSAIDSKIFPLPESSGFRHCCMPCSHIRSRGICGVNPVLGALYIVTTTTSITSSSRRIV